MKKWPKSARFQGKKNPKTPEIYDKFQQVAKNIEGCVFFKRKLSYLVCNHNWVNYFLDDRHLKKIHKILYKKILPPPHPSDALYFGNARAGFTLDGHRVVGPVSPRGDPCKSKLGTLPKWSQGELQPRWKLHREAAHIEFVETSFHFIPQK